MNIRETKKFFVIPSKLINNKKVSPISVVNLDTGTKDYYKKGEIAFLEVDIPDGGYKISWEHMREEREILVTESKHHTIDIQLKDTT